MHHLQKYILDRLRFEQPLGYGDMLPRDVVSSHFQYHLKSLQNEGLVQKRPQGQYCLTHAGQAALEYMSVGRVTPIRMPKVISYTLLTCGDVLLLLRKQKEPYRHLLEPIGGKIHFGENPSDAAQREVAEKTGLHVDRPVLCGVANMLINKNGEPLTHMTVYAHRATVPKVPSLLPSNAIAATEADLARTAEFVPGTPRLMQAILAAPRKPFVLDITAEAQ